MEYVYPLCHNGNGTSFPQNGQLSRWDDALDRLKVDGSVKHPLNWSLFDIKMHTERLACTYLECSNPDNEALPTTSWVGIATSDITLYVEPLSSTEFVTIHGKDGHEVKIRLEDFIQENNLIAVAQDGKTITDERGGPLRLILANLDGWYSVKEVESISFS